MPDNLTADEQSKYIYRAAERQLRLFFDRLRRACKKAGVSLKYVAVTANMDGATGKPARAHHHVVVNFEALPHVEHAWKKQGFVFSKKVNVDTDSFPLAYYLLSQVPHRWNAKKYVMSRGLTKPQEICSIVSSMELPEPPTGAVVYERTANSIVYMLPESKEGMRGRKASQSNDELREAKGKSPAQKGRRSR